MQILRVFISSLLSLSLLWAGAGFSVSRHYCLGMLKSESFYIEAEFCNTHYNTNAGEESCSSDCCDQEWISIDAVEIERSVQDDFQIQLPPFDFKVIDFSALLHRFSEFEHLPSLPENLLLTRPALAQLQCYLI